MRVIRNHYWLTSPGSQEFWENKWEYSVETISQPLTDAIKYKLFRLVEPILYWASPAIQQVADARHAKVCDGKCETWTDTQTGKLVEECWPMPFTCVVDLIEYDLSHKNEQSLARNDVTAEVWEVLGNTAQQ